MISGFKHAYIHNRYVISTAGNMYMEACKTATYHFILIWVMALFIIVYELLAWYTWQITIKTLMCAMLKIVGRIQGVLL